MNLARSSFALAALLIAVQGAPASAQCLSVDVPNFASGGGFLTPSGLYGGVGPAGYWNAGWVDLFSSTTTHDLLDVNGAPTSARVTLGGYSGTNAFSASTSTEDEKLLHDFMWGLNPLTVDFDGLADGTYEVVVYSYDLIDADTSLIDAGGPAGVQACGGSFYSGSLVEGVTHVRDTVTVTGGLLSIRINSLSGDHAFNGVQLIATGCPQASAYCSTNGTSAGCGLALSGSGTLRVEQGSTDFRMQVADAPAGELYYVVFGRSTIAKPWSSTSQRCLRFPVSRMAFGTTPGGGPGCGQAFEYPDANAWFFDHPLQVPAPGTPAYFQLWVRDFGSTKGSAFSDALAGMMQP